MVLKLPLRTFVLSLVFDAAVGRLLTNPVDLNQQGYDYVVVGAGAGGGLTASRLSENPYRRVLLIEAGVNNVGLENVSIPFLAPGLVPNTAVDWNYTTTPQAGLDGRSLAYSHGKLLGGTTSINRMVYTRGSDDDWNRYAQLTGDPGWSWNAVLPLMHQLERIAPPADRHNTAGEYNPLVHGSSGPVGVSLLNFPNPISSKILATTRELPRQFPFNLDMNSGNPLGVGWAQWTIQNGARVSSATAFIQPAINRRNLDVLINTHVTKVLQTGMSGGIPMFRAVQMAQSAKGPLFRANARREVIISAGAIATPQLLMLSGIGDPAQLSRIGIPTLVNLTDVGKNLHDHTNVPMAFIVNATNTLDTFLRDPARQNAALQEWHAKRMGQYTTSPGTHLGWFRLPADADIFESVTDPSAGSHAPHYELLDADFFNSAVLSRPATGNYISLTCVLISPTSRGSVTLSSSNPFTFPKIDPALLQSPFDVFTLREAIKSAREFLSAPVWRGYVVAPFGPAANATTDEEIEEYARANAGVSWHSVGTARMSPRGEREGVVDPDLKVKGTVGLRVVDASVLPVIPGAHTQVPTYIIAERAVLLIQAANQ